MYVNKAANPEIILWENRGVSMMKRIGLGLLTAVVIAILLFISYAGQIYFQQIEKVLF